MWKGGSGLKDARNGLALAGMTTLEHGTPCKISGTISMTTHRPMECDEKVVADRLNEEEILNLPHSMLFLPSEQRMYFTKEDCILLALKGVAVDHDVRTADSTASFSLASAWTLSD
mmetsp:Transcript_16254/g.24088  ORF Transcript_16254/g.24088 Transcript_16254/m.24088 type:complete len:116 (-) Transcript_16254:32-379(-)